MTDFDLSDKDLSDKIYNAMYHLDCRGVPLDRVAILRIKEAARRLAAARLESLTADTVPREGVYVASKTKHAPMWREMRDDGVPIISTWIDEAGEGESSDLADLWRRCIAESKSAEILILYREPEDVLKGAWVELGAALASGTTVFAVGIEDFTVARDRRIKHFPDIQAAFSAAYRQRKERGA